MLSRVFRILHWFLTVFLNPTADIFKDKSVVIVGKHDNRNWETCN